tara:strand:- start:828 stop:1592 length:765 start_codon:yes stop_codon:yes gene_type:complete
MTPEEQNNFNIYPLPVLKDNLIWIWVVKNDAVVIDPSISEPVEAWLKRKDLNLRAILQTHHHEDHIGGTKALIRSWPKTEVIASKKDLIRIPFQTISVIDGTKISLLGYTLEVIEVPGHTNTHIAFYLKGKGDDRKTPALFCGDTLFGGGCGKLFEGSPKNMYISLNRIKSLPLETQIFCAHEYTEGNLRWANSLYPEDIFIKARLQKIIKKRRKGLASLPSNLSIEIKTNLFLRAENIKEFSFLRNHKDNWIG